MINHDKIRFLTGKFNKKRKGIWRIIIQIPFLLRRLEDLICITDIIVETKW